MEDILPLYVDECCSDDTKSLVDEHLMECDDCGEKLIKLRKPMFLSQEPYLNEKEYAKHKKRAFKKLRRRWVTLTLIILMFLIPLIWLGVNEVKGVGIGYSSLPYAFRGNELLRALENGNYEKAFSFLNLKALYDRETEFEETDIASEYTPVKIGGDIFYVDEETYKNEYQYYMTDKDEAVFWRSIYFKNNYMIPTSKAELYLNDIEAGKGQDFMEYMVNGIDYYIDGDNYNYDINNVGNSIFIIMPEEYYNRVKINIMEEEKETKEIIQKFIDMGYDGYVAEYRQQWINNFEQLKGEGITIVGSKLTLVDHVEGRYQLNYQLKLNVSGNINYDYHVTFMVKENGFYPSGGGVSGLSMEADKIPIIGAFGHSLNTK
jgi:hypothetical protein